MTNPTRNFMAQRASAIFAQLTDATALAAMDGETKRDLVAEYGDLKAAMSAVRAIVLVQGVETYDACCSLWTQYCERHSLRTAHYARMSGDGVLVVHVDPERLRARA